MSYGRPLVEAVTIVLPLVRCPPYHSDHIKKGGQTTASRPRYKGPSMPCPPYTFPLDLIDTGYFPESKEPIIARALKGSGIRDTARVVKISPTTVLNELKKSINPDLGTISPCSTCIAQRCRSGHSSCRRNGSRRHVIMGEAHKSASVAVARDGSLQWSRPRVRLWALQR